MKNLKLSRKLFISYALILTMLILGCAVSVVDLLNMGEQTETFYEGPFMVNGSANIINSNFERMQKAVYRSISNSDPVIIKDAIADAGESAAIIQEQLPVIREHFLGDPQIIERLEDALTRLAPMREKVLQLAGENKNAEAAAYMENNNIFVIQEAQEELDSLVENGNRKGEELVAGLKEKQEKAIVTLLMLGSISVVISIVFGVYITRGITRPVDELEKAARSMAKGELSDVKIRYKSRDEMGNLAENIRTMTANLVCVIQDETKLLNQMAEGNFNVQCENEECYVGEFRQLLESMKDINTSLSDTLLQISQSADEVASGSEQVSSGAQVLARGATEVRNLANKSASASKSTAALIEKSLRTVEHGKRTANETDEVLREVVEGVDSVAEALNHITEASVKQSDAIRHITDSLTMISGVVQTNSEGISEEWPQVMCLRPLFCRIKWAYISSSPRLASPIY